MAVRQKVQLLGVSKFRQAFQVVGWDFDGVHIKGWASRSIFSLKLGGCSFIINHI